MNDRNDLGKGRFSEKASVVEIWKNEMMILICCVISCCRLVVARLA